MARKTKQEAQETRQHILDVALRLFSQQGVSSTSLGEIAKAAGVTRGAIYWHFKDKSDLFSEIWELSESNIGELELEYQAKFPGDPLSVLREILIHVLESTVTEERYSTNANLSAKWLLCNRHNVISVWKVMTV